MEIYLNGQYLSDDICVIHANDRGLLLGDGIFETIKSVNGELCFFERHYDRLAFGANSLKIPLKHTSLEVREICEILLSDNKLKQQSASLRITLTRGPSIRGLSIPREVNPTCLITAASYEKSNADVRLCLTKHCRNEYSQLSQLKAIQYLPSILAREEAIDQGFDDGLILNTKGHIVCASAANVFFVIDAVIVTPPISDGILPGVMRAVVLDYCKLEKIAIAERSISLSDLDRVSAGFLTNSLIGVQSISQLESRMLVSESPNLNMTNLKQYIAAATE